MKLRILLLVLLSWSWVSSAAAQNCVVSGNPMVRFETTLGEFNVVLCSSEPSVTTTVDNFLDYVDSGAYTTTGFVHRALTPALSGSFGIIQGGSFYIQAGTTVANVVTQPPIPLEAGFSNLRGTLAMARTSVPDSATSGWFINTEDNLVFDPGPGQDGYAVFGQVVANGMDVVDAIVNQQNWNFGTAFTNLPLIDFPNDGSSPLPYLVYVTDVVFVPEPALTLQLVAGALTLVGLERHRRRRNGPRD